jgi:hypothetical protein
VNLVKLRAEATWLEKIAAFKCPWPIITADDLSEYAGWILDDPDDDLTLGDVRRIKELIDRLKPPRERARLALRKKRELERKAAQLSDPKALEKALARALQPRELESRPEKWRPWQSAGARARAKKSKRSQIISHWQKCDLPLRGRAGAVARKHGVSSHYVRKLIRDAGLRP